MSGRIEELEKALDAKRQRKSPRLVSLLADMGGKKIHVSRPVVVLQITARQAELQS
jgi:hypothetical protein